LLLRVFAARRGEHGSEASDEGATVHSSDLRLAAMLALDPHLNKAGQHWRRRQPPERGR